MYQILRRENSENPHKVNRTLWVGFIGISEVGANSREAGGSAKPPGLHPKFWSQYPLSLGGGFVVGGTSLSPTGEEDLDFFLVRFEVASGVGSVPQLRPVTARLQQNYPNPFNATTEIQFTLPRSADIVLSVFDVTGRLARTITEGEFPAGEHRVSFDATSLASGVYFYMLRTGDVKLAKKLLLLK